MIGNVLSAVYYLLYYRKGASILSIHAKDFSVKDGICRNVLAIGVPASLGPLMMSASQILLNGRLMAYGGMAVAGMGVASKVTMITGMVCLGLGQGVQPLLGYCVGAKLWDRFKKALVFSLGFALSIGVVMTGVCYLLTEQIVNLVLTNPEAFDFGCRFSRILLTTSFLFGAFHVFANTLQAMGAATPSLIINMSRQGILFIPILFVLEAAMGLDGLLWAQPVVDVLSMVLAVVLYCFIYPRMSRDPK